jgi:hypothetical protein
VDIGAAFAAEFLARGDFGAAGGAFEAGDNGVKLYSVDKFGRIHGFLTELHDGGFAFDGGDFLIHFRRAINALVAHIVPADIAADPGAAAAALVEKRAYFGHGFAQGIIVGRTADHALYVSGGFGSASKDATEQATGGAEGIASHADRAGLEGRHITVAAAFAVKTKLKTAIGGKVGVVIGKRNMGCHVIPRLSSRYFRAL